MQERSLLYRAEINKIGQDAINHQSEHGTNPLVFVLLEQCRRIVGPPGRLDSLYIEEVH